MWRRPNCSRHTRSKHEKVKISVQHNIYTGLGGCNPQKHKSIKILWWVAPTLPHPAEQLGELPGEDDRGDAAGAEGGDEEAGGGDLAGHAKARLFGVANGTSQSVHRTVGKLSDQDQAGGDHEQAPAPLVDSQKRGGDGDQRPAVAVREEAGIASNRVLQAADPCEHLASRVAAIGPSGQLGGRIELVLKTVLVKFRNGDQAPALPRRDRGLAFLRTVLCARIDHDPGASVLVHASRSDSLSLSGSIP